jgi:hypothetical protein
VPHLCGVRKGGGFRSSPFRTGRNREDPCSRKFLRLSSNVPFRVLPWSALAALRRFPQDSGRSPGRLAVSLVRFARSRASRTDAPSQARCPRSGCWRRRIWATSKRSSAIPLPCEEPRQRRGPQRFRTRRRPQGYPGKRTQNAANRPAPAAGGLASAKPKRDTRQMNNKSNAL